MSGGGLQTRRTVTVGDPGAVTGTRDWQISGAYRDQVAAALQRADADRAEHNLWGIAVPIALGVAALSLAVAALRHRRPPRDPPRPVPASTLTATPADLP